MIKMLAKRKRKKVWVDGNPAIVMGLSEKTREVYLLRPFRGAAGEVRGYRQLLPISRVRGKGGRFVSLT